tara:strand:+ start:1160 stop:1432 length:273 start_codon:yes stop_codon:yes gene_type:complete
MKTKYIIYAKDGCPYCDMLLEYMKSTDKSFVYLLLFNLEEDLKEVKGKYEWETVPIVIELEEKNAKEKLIGGYTDAIKYFTGRDTGEDTL